MPTCNNDVQHTQNHAGYRWWGALVAGVFGYYLCFALWPGLFRVLGLSHEFGWFWDSYAILASNDAVALGLDPYAVNPLDRLGRPHVYSHWWLELSRWGWTREDNFLFGGAFVAAFLAAALAWLRPKSAKESLVYLAVLASPAVVLGVERANNDLPIFALLAAMAALLGHQKEWVRWLALVPWIVAVALKFYPAAVAPALMLVGGRREAWSRGGLAVAVLGLLWADLQVDFALLGPILPRPEGLLTFGAPQLLSHFGLSWGWAIKCGIVLGGGCVALGWFWREEGSGNTVDCGSREIAFAIGALALAGCFLAGANYAYRYVYVLLMAPLLWGDFKAAIGDRKYGGVILMLMMVVLWFDGVVLSMLACFAEARSVESLLKLADRIALCWQPVVWALMGLLLWRLGGIARRRWQTLEGKAEIG